MWQLVAGDLDFTEIARLPEHRNRTLVRQHQYVLVSYVEASLAYKPDSWFRARAFHWFSVQYEVFPT